LGDTQASQVYGIESESSGTWAVNATDQLVFHACSGGHTENVENVWSQSLPYLRGVQDFDQNVRECQVKTLSGQEISKRISVGMLCPSAQFSRLTGALKL